MRAAHDSGPWYCSQCGRERLARRCGCQGTARDAAEAVGLLGRAQALRAAAELHPSSAAENLRDAARLESMAALACRRAIHLDGERASGEFTPAATKRRP